jgi:hypothetical protein
MKRIFRLAAITSSVLLVSGYIMYRGHAADPGDRVLPGSKVGRISRPQQQATLPSSKSDRIVVPTTEALPNQSLLLSGSKSAAHVIDSKDVIFFSEITTQPATTPSIVHPQPSSAPVPQH